jgi:hypothetical protein
MKQSVATGAIRDAVVGREAEVFSALGIRWTGTSTHIHCPYPDHDDKHPSWRWDVGKRRAFCTCGTASIFDVVCRMRSINFEAAKIAVAEMIRRPDLIRHFSAQRGDGGRGRHNTPDNGSTAQHPLGCTLAAYAEAKKLPMEFLRSLGLTDVFINGMAAVKIPYFDANGTDAAVRFRIAVEGRDKFRWRKGSKPTLYGLNRLGEARKADEITIVEGESDCHVLWNAGFPAIGIPGASTWNEDRDAALFDNFSCINVVIEPDNGGEQTRRWLEKSKMRDRMKLVPPSGSCDSALREGAKVV